MPKSSHIEKSGQDYRPVAELLDAYRKRDAAKVALVDVDCDKRITFGELAALVDRTALLLTNIGMRPGARILLLADSSIEKIIFWLGIWRIGAVVCPLNLNFIRKAADVVVETIAPDLVLTDGRQADFAILRQRSAPIFRFAEWQAGATDVRMAGDRILFDTQPESHRHDHAIGLLPSPAITDIACMTCTSGTTGIPKIVVYDHLALWENGRDSIDLLNLQPEDRTLEYRSLGWYSAQILSLMPFLQIGLTLHLARKFSYYHLADWIDDHRITVCVGIPTVINILLNQPIPEARKRFASLRAMTSSTAPLAAELWSRFEDLYGVPLLNLYGSSETGWVCGNGFDSHRIGTVGQPVPSVEVDIVSEQGKSCPPETMGQMAVSTGKLALAYLEKNGALQAIRGKPFSLHDMAVMDRHGYVHILGRADDLINRGGVKIPPSEIEDVMLTHADVLETAVVGVPDAIYGQVPVCFVVPKPGRSLKASDIVTHCAMHLPRGKIPADAMMMESLPRNPRGKILRKSLLEIYVATHSAKSPREDKR